MIPYKTGTTHPTLVKQHGSYFTLVDIGRLSVSDLLTVDQLCGNEAAETLDFLPYVVYQVIDASSDFRVTSVACCPENAFRTAWEDIAIQIELNDAA